MATIRLGGGGSCTRVQTLPAGITTGLARLRIRPEKTDGRVLSGLVPFGLEPPAHGTTGKGRILLFTPAAL